MKIFSTCFLLVIIQSGFAQTPVLFDESFTESTSDQEKFATYLDSIDKYIYRDVKLTEEALLECNKLLLNNIALEDSLILGFDISRIYYHHSLGDPLEAYKVIVNRNMSIDSMNISTIQMGTYNYITSYTYMEVGDLESSQTSYYYNLEIAQKNLDTSSVITNLYSLGQLYNDENDSDEATKFFKEIIEYADKIEVRPSTMTLVYIELGQALYDLGEYDEALECLEIAKEMAQDYDLNVFTSDILIQEGLVYLSQNKIEKAKDINKQLEKINQNSEDYNVLINSQFFQSELYTKLNLFDRALAINKEILSTVDSTDLDNTINAYSNAHELCKQLGYYKSGYQYLRLGNNVKQRRDEDAKKQQTSYLKIKYDTEEKELENILLTTKVNENKAQSKILYLSQALSALILALLLGAFYQKRRYSKKLEDEVLQRTANLKTVNEKLHSSNKELTEFNRILSHDLKEPLRSIVGFSQLALKKQDEKEKVQDYLNNVVSSAAQLERLIGSINLFQNTTTICCFDKTVINIQDFFEDLRINTQENHSSKKIALDCDSKQSINAYREILQSTFSLILDNAAAYNKNQEVKIDVNYQLKGDSHIFEIKDNGNGIDPKYQDQVFKMFRRLENRGMEKGSGMGLNIAQKQMEEIGGSISISDSKIGTGTTFLIQFPESSELKPS